MTSRPLDESPIDASLAHYMEQRALAIALEKAGTSDERATVERLIELRRVLMQRRGSFLAEAVAKRHARGEIYSRARVAAINAMGPTRSDLERNVDSSYRRQHDSQDVLKSHARSHFGYGLVSARLLLAANTPDIADAARAMQRHEDVFAEAWVDAIADAGFKSELRHLQRDALRMLRTSSRPMHPVAHPAIVEFADLDAQALGKAWNKLDELAQELGVEPLSSFIAFSDEGDAAGTPADRIVITLTALIQAVQSPDRKFTAKRALVPALTRVRDALLRVAAAGGRAHFEVDL